MWNDKKTGFSDISGIVEGAVDAAIGKELKRKGIHLHRVGYIFKGCGCACYARQVSPSCGNKRALSCNRRETLYFFRRC